MTFTPNPKQLYKPKEVKTLKRTGIVKRYQPTGEGKMFAELWIERAHNCEWCKKYLGQTLNHAFFDHITPKSKSEAGRLDKDNIRLLCIECHNVRHRGTKAQIAERIK